MQEFRSDFSLGKAFTGNSPYTLMAWIYMENISTNECIADLTNVGGELEKVVLGYGTDTQAGVVSHHGSFEDMGLPGLQATKDGLYCPSHLMALWKEFIWMAN